MAIHTFMQTVLLFFILLILFLALIETTDTPAPSHVSDPEGTSWTQLHSHHRVGAHE